jgi:hypothetical protein
VVLQHCALGASYQRVPGSSRLGARNGAQQFHAGLVTKMGTVLWGIGTIQVAEEPKKALAF